MGWRECRAVRLAITVAVVVGALAIQPHAAADNPGGAGPTGVIFLHPDGMGANTWGAARMLWVGPDGDLEWDRLPAIAVYRGHLSDALAATSNGGGTAHALGVRVAHSSFGNDNGAAVVGPDGRPVESVAVEALRRGIAVGIVNTASVVDAGTGVFLASVASRRDYDSIAAQMLERRPNVLLGGGEAYFLPKDAPGRHGRGSRADGRNLIEEARSAGYVVVFTREELASAVESATEQTRLLGLFARRDTFLDATEEKKRETGEPYWVETAPTIAEMTSAALAILAKSPTGFLLVAEEEGTDNFGARNNARGVLEAVRRADEAVGVARRFVAERPRTLLLVASDSDAGGMQVIGEAGMDPEKPVSERDPGSGAALDGRDGTGTPPFLAGPDRAGRRLPFAIAWATTTDAAGGGLVRGEGYRAAEMIRGTVENTRIAWIIREVLWGE